MLVLENTNKYINIKRDKGVFFKTRNIAISIKIKAFNWANRKHLNIL